MTELQQLFLDEIQILIEKAIRCGLTPEQLIKTLPQIRKYLKERDGEIKSNRSPTSYP